MSIENIPAEMILFFIIYGVTGAIPLIAAIYLLLRRSNAFAPDVTPPLRLRIWTASFFAVSTLGHVWWYLFYVYSGDIHSPYYVLVAVFDCALLLITIAGTLLSMLQDRKRPVWPILVALLPVVPFGVLHLFSSDDLIMSVATIYILTFYVLFSAYVAYSAWRYGQWLNENFADLENKKVWLIQLVSLFCLLLIILYALVETDMVLMYLLHVIGLVVYILLLWRVETLPKLELPVQAQPQQAPAVPANIDMSQIEQLLAEHCVNTQLYLQHDLTLQQLAQSVGTNRFYLSQYFSRQGITYNTYINNLRINHFISSYNELSQAEQPIVAQQLASESGYRSYSTFSLAFKQRMGQSVTAWMRQSAE